MANKEIRLMNFSVDDNFDIIVNDLATLAASACAREYPKLIKVDVMNSEEYGKLNEKVKKAMVGYAAEKSGISVKDETDMLFAADNKTFVSVLNSIEVRAIAKMMVRYDNPLKSTPPKQATPRPTKSTPSLCLWYRKATIRAISPTFLRSLRVL